MTFKALLMSSALSIILGLVACSPKADIDNANTANNANTSPDKSIDEPIRKTPPQRDKIAAPIEKSSPTLTPSANPILNPIKQDLVDLLGWFEEGCGFSKYMTDSDPILSASENRYAAFKQTFMTERYDADVPVATVTSNYQLPKLYRDVVSDINVEKDDEEGVHYYITFKQATYRGYDLDKLEIFYKPQSDYLYDVLYFKDADFMALQPEFNSVYMAESDWDRGGNFYLDDRKVVCYLGY